MAKSKIDFQQLLLQYGERIGLGIAGAICLLLLFLSLFVSGKGFFAGSPSTMAKTLEDVTRRVDAELNNPNNLPKESDKPPPADDKLQALNREWINADEHSLGPIVTTEIGGSLGRRVPKVLAVEEAITDFKHMRIQSYIFDDRGRIYVLKGEGGRSGGGGAMGGRGGAMGGLAGMMGSMGGGMPGGGMPGMGGGRGGGGMGVPGQLEAMDGERRNRPFELVSLEELAKKGVNGQLAEQVRPVRMAFIAASFPFKKQVEEFRAKLALRSYGEVLGEPAAETGPDKSGLTSFRFTGARVQRRELDGDGHPLDTKGPDGKKLGDWQDLDLSGSYKPYVILTGKRQEPEDSELASVMWPGLYMPRLMQFRESNLGSAAAGAAAGGGGPGMGMQGGGRPGAAGAGAAAGSGEGGGAGALAGGGAGPMAPGAGTPGPTRKSQGDPEDEYPQIEKKLALIKKTIDTLKGKNSAAAVLPPEQFRPGDDFDVFSNRPAASTNTTGGAGPGMGGAGMAGMTMPGRGMGRGAGAGGIPGMGGTGAESGQDIELPDYVVVRLIDVTVEPGKTYEYRLQVKMANPNYNRGDVASPRYSKDKELFSEWTDPEKLPIKVTIDPEMFYYAVDQMEYEFKETNTRRYDGPYKNYFPAPGRETFLQAHRWLETVRLKGGMTLLFGEWTMAERLPVWKGEYVGKMERVEVPVWQFARESFTIASDVTTAKRTPGINVYFGYDRDRETGNKEAILVDFNSGRAGYERITNRSEEKTEPPKKVEDTYAHDALIMRPDGRLMYLEGGLDYGDEKRKERVEKIRKRVQETKKPHRPNQGGPGGAGGPPGNSGG